ncbi:MAG: ATP-binding protein, partial [Firmicutes bacterium]|nr:ATP-binding protein [Bacillota bacterium]
LVTILSYMENNKEDAYKYITDIIGVYQNKTEIIHTGYPEIDGLLNFKFYPALEEGTKINAKVTLPLNMTFPSFDLTVILGNLIDNALEAIALVEENKFIDFKMNYSKGMMVIKISNPYKNALNMENGKLITSKKDKTNHGLGLKSINEILKRYNGITEIETDENTFTITAALYLKQS